MKLVAEIAGGKSELNLRREGTRVTAEIHGRRYELDAHNPETGVYLLTIDGRVYECYVEGTDARGSAVNVHVGNRLYSVILSDPKRLSARQSSAAHAGERAAVVAPMPGKVVRVLVETGAHVEAGDGVIVVEAMKMQNEMKSPKAGTVTEIHATAGATVNAGDVLVVVE